MDNAKREALVGKICDGYCKYPNEVKDEDELDKICLKCPMNELIGGD